MVKVQTELENKMNKEEIKLQNKLVSAFCECKATDYSETDEVNDFEEEMSLADTSYCDI